MRQPDKLWIEHDWYEKKLWKINATLKTFGLKKFCYFHYYWTHNFPFVTYWEWNIYSYILKVKKNYGFRSPVSKKVTEKVHKLRRQNGTKVRQSIKNLKMHHSKAKCQHKHKCPMEHWRRRLYSNSTFNSLSSVAEEGVQIWPNLQFNFPLPCLKKKPFLDLSLSNISSSHPLSWTCGMMFS